MKPDFRSFARKAPTKAQQRSSALHVVLQRCAAGLDFPERLIVQMAHTHGLAVAEIEGMIAAERARRGADA